MSCVRVIAFFVLFALVSSDFVLGIEASNGENVAVSAVDGARKEVVEAYEAVLEAERAGADVSGLLDRLDVAVEYLAVANVSLRVEDFDGAIGNASLCVEALDGMADDAGVLRARAVRESGERSWMAVGGSIVGVGVVGFGCWVGWSFFKKRYYERGLRLKPEVVQNES